MNLFDSFILTAKIFGFLAGGICWMAGLVVSFYLMGLREADFETPKLWEFFVGLFLLFIEVALFIWVIANLCAE